MHKAKATAFGLVVLAALVFVSNAKGQTNSFKKTILSSESQGSANVRSADLVNAWSMAHIAGTPAGVVANTGAGFKIEGMRSEFIEAGEDGTISGRLATNPMGIRAVENSKMGAVYKGLALITDSSGAQMLLAANFHAGVVEAFDSNFAPVHLQGTFQDPAAEAGFAPLGIHVVADNRVVVTFAQQNSLRHDPVTAPGAGFVSLFDFQGNFLLRIASGGTLNAPMGAAIAPATFGSFGGALLVGNFGDGRINAFDMHSATFLGQLNDTNAKALIIPSLRELMVASTGHPNALFLTAGNNDATHSVFAEVTPDTTATPTFSLSASPATLTVTRGTSGTVTITATAMNGFTGPINGFACTGMPLYSGCAFSKTSLAPSGSTTDSLTLRVQTNTPSPNPGPIPYGGIAGMGTLLPLSSLGMFGLVMAETRRRKKAGRRTWRRWLGYAGGIALLCGALLSVSGCGSYGSGHHPTPTGSSTVTVTGTSGTEMESTTFSLAVQ